MIIAVLTQIRNLQRDLDIIFLENLSEEPI
jgi:hypothetical protein